MRSAAAGAELILVSSSMFGPTGRMIGRYLEVTGPWDEPRVRKIQGRFVATGMIEGLPHFVMNGLRAIGSALARLNPIPQAESSEGS